TPPTPTLSLVPPPAVHELLVYDRWLLSHLFFLRGARRHRDLHSFPTRRSSDLSRAATGRASRRGASVSGPREVRALICPANSWNWAARAIVCGTAESWTVRSCASLPA